MIANINFGFEFTVCEVLFGIPAHSVPDAETINYLKWYLNKSKSKEQSIFFLEFLIILREKLESTISGAAGVGREVKPWQRALLDVL